MRWVTPRRAPALAFALLVAACGEVPGPAAELEAPPPGAAESTLARPDSRVPPPGAQFPSPEGPREGQGRTWVAKVGGSPRDYPGPAALVSKRGGVADALRLVPPDPTGADVCSLRPAGEDWLGAAATLSVGGEGGCRGVEGCAAALGRLLDRRVSLVILDGLADPERGADPPGAKSADLPSTDAGVVELPSILGALSRFTRARVAETQVRQHVAVVVPPRLDGGLGRLLGDAHGVVVRSGGEDLAERGELVPLDRIVRAGGRRVLLGFPFGATDQGGSDGELRVLALHLANGGGVLEAGAALPERLERARAFLRSRPELVHRTDAGVAVFVDPAAIDAGAVAELTASLDAARLPWAVFLRPLDPDWSEQLEAEHLAGFAALALPRASDLDDALLAAIVRPSDGLPVIVRGSDADAPEARRRVEEAGGRHASLGPSGEGVALDLGAATVRTDLPPSVWIGRVKAPHRGLVVHHLVNRALDPSGRAVPVGGSRLEVRGGDAGAGGRCEATWFVPDEGTEQRIDCAVGRGGAFEVVLPAFASWAIVAVRAVPFDRSSSFGEQPLRLAEQTRQWHGGTIELKVPFWPPDQILSLSLPEVFGGGAGEALAGMTSHVEHWEPGFARLISIGPELRVERELRAGVDSIDVTLTLENLGEEPIPEVSAVICLASDGPTLVPDSGHDNTFFVGPHGLRELAGVPMDAGDPLFPEHRSHALPLTIVRTTDDRYSMASGFEEGRGVGGNGNRNGVCVHARPYFGTLAPGDRVVRRGTLYVTPDRPAEVVARWEAEHGPRETVPGGERRGWRSPCEGMLAP